MRVVIHWFRCDLRLSDNTALHAATEKAEAVVPVFIFDPAILKAPDTGAPITAFMLGCLDSLEKNIAAAGGRLIFRHGEPEAEMREVIRATGATALYFNRDYEPYARQRDAAVGKMARSLGLEVYSFKDGVIHEPEEVLKADGKPYRVFTPYSQAWLSLPKPKVGPTVKFQRPAGLKEPVSIGLPSLQDLGFSTSITLPPMGERAGRDRLKEFTRKGLLRYETSRDFPATEGTSMLSAHFRIGTVSVRTAWAAAENAAAEHLEDKGQIKTYIKELIWREFYRQILWHYPHVAHSAFREEYNDLKWENNERFFAAWCDGRTGFPIVDAGMRQLNTTGWMHNRVRMIVATFLTKDLLISWQWGERYFMQKLIDADLASNNGGWQWSASTGTDAQPYFRIFNPMSQARKFDPEGAYIQHYVPEADTLAYPGPIVDHGRQRLKALALFQRT